MSRTCAHCGQPFEARKSTAVYCGARCRVAANRAKVKDDPQSATVVAFRPRKADPGPRPPVASVEDATAYDLGDLVDSSLGQSALVIARRLDAGSDTSGSAVAALAKQLAELVARAQASRPVAVDDPLEVIRRQVVDIRRAYAERLASGG